MHRYVYTKINQAAPTATIVRDSELTFQQVMFASPSIPVTVERAAPAAAGLCSGVGPMREASLVTCVASFHHPLPSSL